jgi:predicted O-methyltransferase YrrM
MRQELLEKMKEFALLHHVPILREPSTVVLTEAAHSKCPTRVLEIGTAIGYSSLLIASEMQPHGQIISIDIDEERQKIARQFFTQSELTVTLELLLGDANALIGGLTGCFDFVFIDAAKGQYVNYLKALLPHLETGAVIVADNVLFRGWVKGDVKPPRRYRTIVKRLREYLAIVNGTDQFQTKLYDVGDGVAVSRYLGSAQKGAVRQVDDNE